MVRKTNGIIIAVIILVAFVGAASEAILIVTPSQMEVSDLVSLESSIFESNTTVTDVATATVYGPVRQSTSMKYVTNDIIYNPHKVVFSNPQNVYGAAYYDVNLTVDTEAKTTIEGEQATYFLTVKNTGNVTDSFVFTYTNPDNANVVDMDRTQVTLNASETGTVALKVGNATAGTFGIHVTATSQGDSSKADFVSTTTTVDAIVYGVDLNVDNGAKTTYEGINATYTLTVKNTGNVTDSFVFTCTNPDNANVVDLDRTQVTLNASETETVALKVGTTTAGTFGIHVTATSQGDSSTADFVSTTVTVDAIVYDVDLSVDNGTKTTDVGVNATYTLTVNNTGSAEDTFNLTVTNPNNASVMSLNKTQITLNASETGVVALKVGNTVAGKFWVNVTATSQGDSNKTACVNTTTTVVSVVVYGVNLTVDTEAENTDVGVNATYILTVENTGSAEDTFNLTVTNPNNASVTGLSRTQVRLNASETESFTLKVGNAVTGTFRVNVTAASQSDINKTATVSTTTTVISYGVNLTVDPEEKTTVVGENATYTLTLKNTGSVADTFNLTVTNPDIASVALNQTQVQLNASAAVNVSLNVTNATVGTFQVNVTATSQKGTNKTAMVSTTTTVISYGVNLTVDPEANTTVAGENATYTLTVKNTGSVPDIFNLTVTNPDNASVTGLSKTQVQLNASETETVALKVGDVVAGTFRVNVTATSQKGTNKTAVVSTTTTVISYGVNITVDKKAKTVVTGENAVYTLTVENTGSVADIFNLTVTNPDNASVTGLSKTQVQLNASGTETVALKVSNAAIGTFRVNVTATSQKGTNETASVSTTTTVISYGVNLTVDQKAKTVVTGENATYTLTVENTGSVPDIFNLTVTNQDNVSVVGLNMTQVPLNASEAETVALKVGDVAVGTFRVNVTATSQSDISKTACVNTTTTVASLTVTPPSVNVGDFVTIEGAGFGANETLTLSCHVSDLEVPVSGNKYEYSLNEFNLSNSNTSFSLSVREVEDDTEVHIKKQGLPVVVINKDSPSKLGFEFDYNATTHTSTVSVPMPIDPSYTGIYELIEVSGTVVGNTTEVFMDLTVDNSVTTDATGYFKTVIDTHGFPPQEYTITADGVAATLTVCHLIVPDHAVMTGELVTIEGEGFGANETLILSSQSNFTINVSGSEYEYTLKEFNLSDPNTGFSLSVREVKDDMEIQLKKQGGTPVMINEDKYGFKFDYDSTTDTATVSVPMPIDPSYTGIYEFIEVSGTAFGGTSNVYMDIMVINSVTTTESGYFETVIDTHGFPPHEYTITATSATASAKATLTIIPATGAITVTSSPTGAAIELDGNSTKLKTNATISDVSPGTHSIKLTLDGYQGWSENVPVQAGETYYVNATLTPNPTPAPRGGGGGGGGSGGGPADTDGDGYCNIDETIMGTDPEDPCDPDPNCVACQALVGTHILPPVVEQTPRPTSTIKYLTTPTPRPKPTPAATPTPTPKPLLPILGPDKPIILIVIIVAVSVLIAALYFLHRKFKSVDTENHDSDRIVWR